MGSCVSKHELKTMKKEKLDAELDRKTAAKLYEETNEKIGVEMLSLRQDIEENANHIAKNTAELKATNERMDKKFDATQAQQNVTLDHQGQILEELRRQNYEIKETDKKVDMESGQIRRDMDKNIKEVRYQFDSQASETQRLEASMIEKSAMAREENQKLQTNLEESVSQVHRHVDDKASGLQSGLNQLDKKVNDVKEEMSAKIEETRTGADDQLERHRRVAECWKQKQDQNIKDAERRAKEHADKSAVNVQAEANQNFSKLGEELRSAKEVVEVHRNTLAALNTDLEEHKSGSQARWADLDDRVTGVDERAAQNADTVKRDLHEYVDDVQQKMDSRTDKLQDKLVQETAKREETDRESRAAREGLSEDLDSVKQDFTTEKEMRGIQVKNLQDKGEEANKSIRNELKKTATRLQEDLQQQGERLTQQVQTSIEDSKTRTASAVAALQEEVDGTKTALKHQKAEIERVDEKQDLHAEEMEKQTANHKHQLEEVHLHTESSIAASQRQVRERLTERDEQLAKEFEVLNSKTHKQETETAHLTHKLDDEVKTLHAAMSKQDKEHELKLVDAEAKMQERVETASEETRRAMIRHEQETQDQLGEVKKEMNERDVTMNDTMGKISGNVDNLSEQLVETSDRHSKRLHTLEEDNTERATQADIAEQDRRETVQETNRRLEVHEQRFNEMEGEGARRQTRLEESIENHQRALQEEMRQREENKKQIDATLSAAEIRVQKELRQQSERLTQAEDSMTTQVTQLQADRWEETRGTREHIQAQVITLQKEMQDKGNASQIETESVRKEMRLEVDNINARVERTDEKVKSAERKTKEELENVQGTLQEQIEQNQVGIQEAQNALQEQLGAHALQLEQVTGEVSSTRSELREHAEGAIKLRNEFSEQTNANSKETRELLEKEKDEMKQELNRRFTEADNSVKQHVQTSVQDSEVRTAANIDTLREQQSATKTKQENQKTEIERIDEELKSQGEETERRFATQEHQTEELRTETEARITASQGQVMERLTQRDEQLAKELDQLNAKKDKQATETAKLEQELKDEVKTLHKALSKQDEEHERLLVDAESKLKEKVEIAAVETREAISQLKQDTQERFSEAEEQMRTREAAMNESVTELNREVGYHREQLAETSDDHSRKLQALEEENIKLAQENEKSKQERQKTVEEMNHNFDLHEQRHREMDDEGAQRETRLKDEMRGRELAFQNELRHREQREQQVDATLQVVQTQMTEMDDQRRADIRQLESTLTDRLGEEAQAREQALASQMDETQRLKEALDKTKVDLGTVEGKVKHNEKQLEKTKDRLLTESERHSAETREMRERQDSSERQSEKVRNEALTTVAEINCHFQQLEEADKKVEAESQERDKVLRDTLVRQQQQALNAERQERESMRSDFTTRMDTMRLDVDRSIQDVRGQVSQQGERMVSMERKSRKNVSEVKRRLQQYRTEFEEQKFDELREQTQQARSSVALLQRVVKQQIGDGSELVPMQDQDTSLFSED